MPNELPGVTNENSVQPTPDSDKFLLYLREITAVVIAAAVVVGFAVMLYLTYGYVNAPPAEPTYQRAKDLLLIIDPFLGIVIGYYFNKVSTESRAEHAEANARTATETAKNAEGGKDEAQKESEAAKTALANLTAAADSVLDQISSPAAMGIAAAEAGGSAGAVARLRSASERAKAMFD